MQTTKSDPVAINWTTRFLGLNSGRRIPPAASWRQDDFAAGDATVVSNNDGYLLAVFLTSRASGNSGSMTLTSHSPSVWDHLGDWTLGTASGLLH